MNYSGKLIIGDFIIDADETEVSGGPIWIYRSSGEGMRVTPNQLEKLIEDYYEENL